MCCYPKGNYWVWGYKLAPCGACISSCDFKCWDGKKCQAWYWFTFGLCDFIPFFCACLWDPQERKCEDPWWKIRLVLCPLGYPISLLVGTFGGLGLCVKETALKVCDIKTTCSCAEEGCYYRYHWSGEYPALQETKGKSEWSPGWWCGCCCCCQMVIPSEIDPDEAVNVKPVKR